MLGKKVNNVRSGMVFMSMRRIIEYFKNVKGNEIRYSDKMCGLDVSKLISAWMRRVATGDINESLRVANESRRFFKEFMKKNPRACNDFKKEHDRLAEAIMEKITGAKPRFD